jgi:hypothetical protein
MKKLFLIRYIHFIAFVAGIILSGCNDTEGVLELKGKVLDKNTKVPIPDRKIIVQAVVRGDIKYISSYAGELSTDNSGSFAFTLNKIKSVNFYDFCVVGDSAYASSNTKLGLTDLTTNSKTLSFFVDKLADLTIKFERVSKTAFRDTLFVSWASNGLEGKNLYPYKIENYGTASNLGFRWVGGDVKSAIRTKVFADKKTTVNWSLFRNGKLKEITDTIYCTKNGANSIFFKY